MRSLDELMHTAWGDMEQDERIIIFKEERRRNPVGHAETQATLEIYKVLSSLRSHRNDAVVAEKVLNTLGAATTEWKTEYGRVYVRRAIYTPWVQDDS
jgi:hypothetical protein